jgi:hypothetical protein
MIALDMKSWAKWLGVIFLITVVTGIVFGTQSVIYYAVSGYLGLWLMGPFLLAIWNIPNRL